LARAARGNKVRAVLIDNEIGRPKVVEPSGVEGYFARLRGLVARVARVDYLG